MFSSFTKLASKLTFDVSILAIAPSQAVAEVIRAKVKQLSKAAADLLDATLVAWRYKLAGDLQWQYTERQEVIHPAAIVEALVPL